MSASKSTFLREAVSCCANRALPRRPLLVEAIGVPGVGPGGAVSGVRFGEEVWGPEVCLLLLMFAAFSPPAAETLNVASSGVTGAGALWPGAFVKNPVGLLHPFGSCLLQPGLHCLLLCHPVACIGVLRVVALLLG